VCVNARPEEPWPRLLRGHCESELGFRLRRSLDVKPSKESEAEYKAAVEDFDAVLKKERDPLVRYVGLANRGVLNIRRFRYDEAVDDLRDAIEVKPQALQPYVPLSLALEGLEKWDEALSSLNDAIRLAPELPALYERRAELYLTRKNRPAARADFEKAIALTGDAKTERHAGNLVQVGRQLHREKKYPEAMASFDRALKLVPGYVLTQRFRAETLLALDRIDEAAKALDAYLAKTKVVPAEVYQARGLIHAGAGQQPAAIDMYSAALRLNPKDTKTRSHRGWTYLSIDAPRLALADFEAWLREAPASPEALIGRASARVRLKQLDAAVADAVAAEKVGLLTDRLLFNLACVYAQAAVLAEDAPGQNRRAARRLAYEEKAAQYLRRTLEEMSAEKRSKFWRGQVMTDPALVSLRRGKMFVQLGKDFGQSGS
jgi:tetratricopeptide (TPR) repeat protein